MFTYKNGRFYLGSASFALPNDCIVDTSLPVDSHNGLVIEPLDQSFKILVDFGMNGLEPGCGLTRLAENWNGKVEVKEEHLPCGIGWSALFEHDRGCYRDLCIPLKEGALDEDGNMLNEMDIQTVAKNAEEVKMALQHKVYLELIGSIANIRSRK